MKNKKFGLCCISNNMKKKNLNFCKVTKKKFDSMVRDDAMDLVSKKTLNNLTVIKETLLYCGQRNWNYRIGGNILPLSTLYNFRFDDLLDKDIIFSLFGDCANIIRQYNIRCSMHPDQFVVPASDNPSVVKKSIVELNHHAEIMDLFQLDRSYNSPINIHMNCYKGRDLKVTSKRFISVYNELSLSVRNRLVLENEDKDNSWGVKELYDYIYLESGIPITYDNLHFKCNKKKMNGEDAYDMCKRTWNSYIPIFHFSDNIDGDKNMRKHADNVTSICEEYNNGDRIDLEFEFKNKDIAIENFEKLVDN